MEHYLIKGFVIAIIFGVPAGAVGALTIQRSLKGGFFRGFATGLGSTAADLFYAYVSVTGLSAVSDRLIRYQTPFRLTGCVLILIYGVLTLSKKETERDNTGEGGATSLVSCFTSAFLIALLNPATILSFGVAFTAVGISRIPGTRQGIQLLCGILAGTTLWWFMLSGIVTIFRQRITDRFYRILNRCLGIFLILFAIGMGVFTVMG